MKTLLAVYCVFMERAPAEEILRAVERLRADLILMGLKRPRGSIIAGWAAFPVKSHGRHSVRCWQ